MSRLVSVVTSLGADFFADDADDTSSLTVGPLDFVVLVIRCSTSLSVPYLTGPAISRDRVQCRGSLPPLAQDSRRTIAAMLLPCRSPVSRPSPHRCIPS